MAGTITAWRALDDSRDRSEFYRMWLAGYSAAFTHPKSFETMGPRQHARVEELRQWLLHGTRRGREIDELVRTGGSRFEDFERALLPLGTESGTLEETLRILTDFYMKKHRLMLWVKKQMAYPFFSALMAAVIAPLQLLFFGHERAYVVTAGTSVALLLFGAGSLVAMVAAFYGRKPALVRARMARGLATAIEAGLPLGRAVRLAAEASADPGIRAFIAAKSEQQLTGGTIASSLAGCPHLTPDFIAVLQTSERTGDFGAIARLAELYEDGFK
jgi:type II secretory pathway component PulF